MPWPRSSSIRRSTSSTAASKTATFRCDAIAAANGSAGADTIGFDASVFNGEACDILRLTQGQIGITDELTIDGGAGVTITGDACGDDVTLAVGITDVTASLAGEDRLDDNSRIFDATADLTLDGLTLTGGRTTAEGEGGGAVRATDNLMLIDSALSGNSTAGYDASGGAILLSIRDFGYGEVTLMNSTVRLILTDSTVSGNGTAGGGAGGGALSVFNLTVRNSTVSGNSTALTRLAAAGSSGNFTLTNSTVSGNTTAGYGATGGGIDGSYESGTVTNSVVLGNATTHGEILIDPDGVIIAGHGRLLAAKALGMAEVPTIALRGLSDAQKRALRLADNKIALGAGWDLDLLKLELAELVGLDVDIDLPLTGFSTGELDVILDGRPIPRTRSSRRCRSTPRTRPGDIWMLGEHRIGCGDGRDPRSCRRWSARRARSTPPSSIRPTTSASTATPTPGAATASSPWPRAR